MRSRPQAAASRRGVVLLIVISLLVLFALVGIAFVIYAESQANTARIWREGETAQRPDMDPELLLSYFLGQLVYDTDNPFSALRGHSLARTMYGKAGSVVPYNGTGRLHFANGLGLDEFNCINYTQFAGAPRDPDQSGSLNPPYTYPDLNNVFLAAVRASDGAVLLPSYQRGSLNSFGTLDQGNPNWNNANGKYLTLRPRPADHSPAFPYPEDLGGDVKNRPDSPGVQINAGNFALNDSIWLDLGFPVMTAVDGRKFKPLFAALIEDLDNRVNVNVHGNIRDDSTHQSWIGTNPQHGLASSDQGLGPWEVNLEKVVTAQEGSDMEARRLFIGNPASGVQGRYDLNFWGQFDFRLPIQYAAWGHFYAPTNIDACPNIYMSVNMPGVPPGPTNYGQQTTPLTSAFPNFFEGYDVGYTWAAFNHPMLYNFFMPQNSYYLPGARDRIFGVGNMEGLLRYGGKGSPALSSDLFRCCPMSFGDPATGAKTRRLVTTHAFDIDRPGVTPWLWSPNGKPTSYTLAPGSLSASGSALPFPAPGTPPANGEFTPQWQAVSAALGRINLNRKLADYPPLNNGAITDLAGFDTAQTARQAFAAEIFNCLRQVTGAADPAAVAKGSPEYNAVRWLAQLAVNIVDFVDTDDYMTPFNWTGNEWVFGTEQPRLVLNEVYAEIANDPSEPANGTKATKDYKVKFWAELHNSLYSGSAGIAHAEPMTENANARLQVPANGIQAAYAAYKLTIATPNSQLRDADNSRGEPDPGTIKTEVADFTPEPAPAPQPTLMGDALNVVQPSSSSASGPNGSNQGYYVLGPKEDFPGSDPNRPTASLRVKDQQVNGQRSSMVYELDKSTDLTQPPKHTLLLRRLACPAMPPQTDPTQPRYNPYVTVDYLESVPTNDGVTLDATGKHVATPVDQRFSVGRNQPYAADKTQQKDQKPAQPLMNQPQNTLFAANEQGVPNRFPFDWLTFIDRQVISPPELLQVSGFKPHELTQQFMTGGTDPVSGQPLSKFTHRAPWFDPSARVYRLLEFFVASYPVQWVPVGGRCVGKININNMWDPETFAALCDARNSNFFDDNDVQTIFQKLLSQRSPTGVPGANDRPFRGMAAPYTSAGDQQYPRGIGIEDTFLCPDPTDANPDPSQRRRLLEPVSARAAGAGHPYWKYDLMKKIFNNFTTRSNVFAVWLTVGFFGVVDDSDPSRPPKLGAEIGRAENRHIRHRMFAILDRSNLTIAFDPTAGQPRPGTPGARPFFIPARTAVPAPTPPQQQVQVTLDVPGVNAVYEGLPWSVSVGMQLVADTGQNQEIVTVTNVTAAPPTITANFTKPHASGFCLSNALLGNPGPQPRFDMRLPQVQGIVRYVSIID
jgi:hypothetical protein